MVCHHVGKRICVNCGKRIMEKRILPHNLVRNSQVISRKKMIVLDKGKKNIQKRKKENKKQWLPQFFKHRVLDIVRAERELLFNYEKQGVGSQVMQLLLLIEIDFLVLEDYFF